MDRLLFLGLAALAISHSSVSRGAQPPAAREFLDAQNQARAAVGVGPLKWNPVLANKASRLVRSQRDRHNCDFANPRSSKYGINQFWRSPPGSAVQAVESWLEEKKYYDYAKNSCAPQGKCGLYTQVVWRASQELGCAQASCPKQQASLTICFYNPPGNVIGERPY